MPDAINRLSLDQIELLLTEPTPASILRDIENEQEEKRHDAFDAIVDRLGILPIELLYLPASMMMEQLAVESNGEVFISPSDLPQTITAYIEGKLDID